MNKNYFENIYNVKFKDLINACEKYFGKYGKRIRGSHYIYKTPWIGDPKINVQKKGNMAKPYQVRDINKAILKLEEMNEKQIRL